MFSYYHICQFLLRFSRLTYYRSDRSRKVCSHSLMLPRQENTNPG